jgi:acyl-CoA thioesterase-1
MIPLRIVVAAIAISSAAAAGETADLNHATGRIFNIDLGARSFELLKETEYDPVTLAGRSRFTVHWSDDTTITFAEEIDDYPAFTKPVIADFSGITGDERKKLERGEAFRARGVTLYEGISDIADIQGSEKGTFGWFTPGEKRRTGTFRVGDKEVPVSLRPPENGIFYRTPIEAEKLIGRFWNTTIQGAADADGRFVISKMDVTPVPDPRKTDDPALPRVLVIGDSISMNYHEAAKAALKGIANYHRNEGNAASSAHGVANAELWLGEYGKKGFHWDVIQFNHGLHDLRRTHNAKTHTWGPHTIPTEAYQKNLERLILILRKTGATLIWASTTPVPGDILGQYARKESDAVLYNQAALEVMKRHPDILINDLYRVVADSKTFDAWRGSGDVHFYKDEELQALGQAVAKGIRTAVEKK